MHVSKPLAEFQARIPSCFREHLIHLKEGQEISEEDVFGSKSGNKSSAIFLMNSPQ